MDSDFWLQKGDSADNCSIYREGGNGSEIIVEAQAQRLRRTPWEPSLLSLSTPIKCILLKSPQYAVKNRKVWDQALGNERWMYQWDDTGRCTSKYLNEPKYFVGWIHCTFFFWRWEKSGCESQFVSKLKGMTFGILDTLAAFLVDVRSMPTIIHCEWLRPSVVTKTTSSALQFRFAVPAAYNLLTVRTVSIGRFLLILGWPRDWTENLLVARTTSDLSLLNMIELGVHVVSRKKTYCAQLIFF